MFLKTCDVVVEFCMAELQFAKFRVTLKDFISGALYSQLRKLLFQFGLSVRADSADTDAVERAERLLLEKMIEKIEPNVSIDSLLEQITAKEYQTLLREILSKFDDGDLIGDSLKEALLLETPLEPLEEKKKE